MEDNNHTPFEPSNASNSNTSSRFTLESMQLTDTQAPLPTSSDYKLLQKLIHDAQARGAEAEEQIKILLGIVTDQQQAIEQLKREVGRLFAMVYNKEEVD